MLRVSRILRVFTIAVTLASSAFASFNIAHAEGIQVLHVFGSIPDDGGNPSGNLIADRSGNFYGTTTAGGKASAGTVYKISTDGTESVLLSLIYAEGKVPRDGVFSDSAGNLYGTASAAGKCNYCGTVFELASNGTPTVLYSFCSVSKCEDGSDAAGSVILTNHMLYGTTYAGGANTDGTIYEVDPHNFTETVLYSFCSQPGCADGRGPYARLLADKAGNLYGTTLYGGNTGCSSGCGVLFKLAADGTETLLHAFCSLPNCADGSQSAASLIADSAGNLYGTTMNGGTTGCGGVGCGTVFEFSPDGTETVLYAFKGGVDGAQPFGSLFRDSSGNFYGTTVEGGGIDCFGTGCGTVFKIAPDGTESILHSFCTELGCPDGAYPEGSLIGDKAGNLYGTTWSGGGNVGDSVPGVFFKLKK